MSSIFGPIFDGIGWLLTFFYSFIPNLGISIILLTLLIMLILYPLTSKQTRSMMAMQRVQPEIKKLQAKYKNDRTKLNEEMMKFYQENKINPLSGCLPLLIQMPVLISLFSVLRKAYDYVPKTSELHLAFCGPPIGTASEAWKSGKVPPCGTILDTAAKVFSANHTPGLRGNNFVEGDPLLHHLHFLGLDLQSSAIKAHNGFLSAVPYFVLVIAVIVTYVFQSRQSSRRTPAANKQMGALMKIMPPFFGLISVTLPSGLVIYLFVSALFRLGQQEFIFRRHGSAIYGPGGKPLDVKSTDRTKTKTATAVIEAEAIEAPQEEEPKSPPQPVVKRPPAPAADPEVAGRTGERGAGLRGFFALPPPPESNGGSGRSASGGSSGGGGAGGAPSSQPRRRNKKKRKR